MTFESESYNDDTISCVPQKRPVQGYPCRNQAVLSAATSKKIIQVFYLDNTSTCERHRPVFSDIRPHLLHVRNISPGLRLHVHRHDAERFPVVRLFRSDDIKNKLLTCVVPIFGQFTSQQLVCDDSLPWKFDRESRKCGMIHGIMRNGRTCAVPTWFHLIEIYHNDKG